MSDIRIHSSIIRLKNTGSSNDYLKELIKKGDTEEGLVIVAEEQTRGKGQNTNTWYSSPGENLTLSILLQPDLTAELFFFLTIITSLAITDTLKKFAIEASIKWPNDIYVQNRKICGILIENTLVLNRISHSVIGIGLNVNETGFPVSLPNPTSMKMILGFSAERETILHDLLRFVFSRYQQLRDRDFDGLLADYNTLLYRRNQKADFIIDNQNICGEISKVLSNGELIIVHPGPVTRSYTHGQLEFIL